MPQVIIRNIPINFPHEPYDCQIDYMTKVIDSLMDNKNAILESPTGTGKTLCLLCACLAWQDHLKSKLINSTEDVIKIHQPQSNNLWKIPKNNKVNSKNVPRRDSLVPRIIYTSRTHSQLGQCIKALKKCFYGNGRKVGMIASRDQLCINNKVMSLETTSARIYGCRKSVQSRQCRFYNQWDKNKEKIVLETPIVDIEDLITAGNKNAFCPYFLSRETFATADIVFMPYNYILDSKVRKMFKIDLSESVVIFDEAHNIEQVCEDSASVEMSSIDVAKAIGELTALGEYIYREQDHINEESDEKQIVFPEISRVLILKQRLLNLESYIDSMDLSSGSEGITESVSFLYEMLQNAGFLQSEKLGFYDTLEVSINVIGMSSDPAVHGIGIKGLELVEAFLKTVFSDNDDENVGTDHLTKCYRVYIQDKEVKMPNYKSVWDTKKKSSNVQKNRVLSFWCLSPGRAMNELIKTNVRNVILTSGTLYPIDSLKLDLNIDIGIELRNSHIIKPEQMMVSVCTKGPDGESLNSSYAFREKISYINSLGNSLVNLTKMIPRGLLVIFPSYSMMKKCIEKWESCNIYSRMLQNKLIVVEPQDKVAFSLAMQKYQTANLDPKGSSGAALLAVARGKVSEGLDLSDHCGRGVVIIGLPYPSFYDPRMKLKMSFLDERKSTEGLGLGGRAWYNLQAYRAVNQSLGRVIRHHRDFGAVYLCDERFASPSSVMQLPHWVQPMVTVHNNFGDVVKATNNFFCTIPLKYPPSSLEIFVEPIPKPLALIPQKPVIKSNVNVPFASNVLSFCSSLKKYEGTTFIDMYSDEIMDATPSKNNEISLMSILKKSECPQPGFETKKRQITEITSIAKVDEIKRPTKRYKLVSKLEEKIDHSKHLTKVKQLLDPDSGTMKSYKTAVDAYSRNGDVDSLFSSLQNIFDCNEQPELVRDFYDHLRPDHKPRYKSLCLTMLGLECGENKENKTEVSAPVHSLDCENCNMSPAIIPVGAPCKHICCLGCWKVIISGENASRRCPKCKVIVLKKNLVKIIVK